MTQRNSAKIKDTEVVAPEAKMQESPVQIALPCSDSVGIPTTEPGKRDTGQVTLSTIGDVSIAAADTLGRAPEASRTRRWLPIVGFFFLVYVVSCALAVYRLDAAPWIRAFLVPLLPVLIALAAFWRRQTWKVRAQDGRFRLKAWQDALISLGHEASNAANAIRANLIGFRLANPQLAADSHLEEIELATSRVEAAVRNSQNPLAGARSKNQKVEASPPPASEGSAPRRISP